MPSRRSHPKSRHGCLRCKERRIKCDEKRPSCMNCVRREASCEYMSVAPLLWSSGNEVQSDSQDQSATISTSDTATSGETLAEEVGPVSCELNLEDLELMMQWCTSTYRSLSRNPSIDWIWQHTIPRESFQHPFLSHGILALSALHLSITSCGHRQEEYLKAAQVHRTKAVTGLTSAVDLVHPSDCNAIYASSNIMIIFAFAFPLSIQPFQPGTALDDLFQVFHIVRSSMDVLLEIIDWIRLGELAPLILRQEVLTTPSTNLQEVQEVTQSLKRLNAALSDEDEHHEANVYDAVIEQLGTALDNLMRGEDAMITIFLWIFKIPTQFRSMMRERRPFAMVILAHYGVIMHNLRGLWWMGQWGTRVIQEIYQSLDMEWRAHITWVVFKSGLSFPSVQRRT